uniref:N-terminal EF-hand calcium binding protein 3 n=1 Tax=Bubo bubo TaxID=30461 RepID=A0A8C0ECV1_BUBBB
MPACSQPLLCTASSEKGRWCSRQYIIILPFYLNADDGKLSFEEFKNYFADGILSSEELWELFILRWHRGGETKENIKLLDYYFSAYLGEYRNVLSALEALNSAVLAAMDKTKLVRMGLREGGGAGGCVREAVVILAAC